MTRIVRAGIFCVGFMVALLAVPNAGAKKDLEYPQGPIPVQVITGKKVFISYMERDADPGSGSGGSAVELANALRVPRQGFC